MTQTEYVNDVICVRHKTKTQNNDITFKNMITISYNFKNQCLAIFSQVFYFGVSFKIIIVFQKHDNFIYKCLYPVLYNFKNQSYYSLSFFFGVLNHCLHRHQVSFPPTRTTTVFCYRFVILFSSDQSLLSTDRSACPPGRE